MNAFDLINVCGGVALNRMFQQPGEKRKSTQFTTSMAMEDIVEKAKEALQSLNCEECTSENGKVKGTLQTPKGAVGIVLQVVPLIDGVNFVEFRRGKGDIFEYHNLFTQLSEKLNDCRKQ